MKKGKCPICGRITYLQKHHYIPQRIKKTDHYVYICAECHMKIHPENEIIITAKYAKKYADAFKKFVKESHPEIWKKWLPKREELKKGLKQNIEDEPTPKTEDD